MCELSLPAGRQEWRPITGGHFFFVHLTAERPCVFSVVLYGTIPKTHLSLTCKCKSSNCSLSILAGASIITSLPALFFGKAM